MHESIRNRLAGTVLEITSDAVMSEVLIETASGPVAAVVTTRSVKNLNLQVGDAVHALIKATSGSADNDEGSRCADVFSGRRAVRASSPRWRRCRLRRRCQRGPSRSRPLPI